MIILVYSLCKPEHVSFIKSLVSIEHQTSRYCTAQGIALDTLPSNDRVISADAADLKETMSQSQKNHSLLLQVKDHLI